MKKKSLLVVIIAIVVVAAAAVATWILWPVSVQEKEKEDQQEQKEDQECQGGDEENAPLKPVIYLYPSDTMDVTVKLDFDGTLAVTYPSYEDGWSVTASPDGTLINHGDGREYSYLFWEGHSNAAYDLSSGFVVPRDSVESFLQEKLAYMGLLPHEYNEFIVYWLPQMQSDPYYLITFQGDAYTQMAKLTVTPQPDSILRVFMTVQGLDKPIDIPTQTLQPFERSGFTLIEWGGDLMG